MRLKAQRAGIQSSRSRGLTLVELVLVLVILAATAGILVPVFGNLMGQSHGATGAANIENVARTMQHHHATYGGYPNQLDLLLDDAGTEAIVPLGGTVAATELTTIANTAQISDALIDAGITTVIRHPETPTGEEDQTIFIGTPVVVDETGPTPANFVTLGTDAIVRLGLDPTDTYVVLGLGNNNTGIGKSMVDAPVHFSSNGNEEVYSRFLVIFRIPDEGAAILATAAAVDVHHGEAEVLGLGGHVREFHHSRE